MSLSPTLQDPRMLPLLPAINVAWADGELSAGEMKSLCATSKRGLVDALLIPHAVLAAPISR